MKKIILILLLLSLTTLVWADVIIKGNRTIYKNPTTDQEVTEGVILPANPKENDYYRDVKTGDIYIYKSGEWVLERKNDGIKAIILSTKNILAGTNPDSTLNLIKRLRNVEKLLWIYFKEQY